MYPKLSLFMTCLDHRTQYLEEGPEVHLVLRLRGGLEPGEVAGGQFQGVVVVQAGQLSVHLGRVGVKIEQGTKSRISTWQQVVC